MKSSRLIMAFGLTITISMVAVSLIITIQSMKDSHADIPPPNIKTIGDFRLWRPTYTNAYRISIGPMTNYHVDNPSARYQSRGPKAYIFRSNGRYREVSDTSAVMWAKKRSRLQGAIEIIQVNIQDIPTPE
jgi:hypothetical protein